MHINQMYEHEPILPCQGEETPRPGTGCNKVATQCVDVAQLIALTPLAEAGTAVVTCQGTPSVTCVTNDNGASCTLTVTQRVCVSVPIRFGAVADPADPTITCADDAPCGTCKSCGY